MTGDTDIIKRVYRSVAIAWVTAASWALAYQKPWIALSITLGTLLGTGMLASLDWFVHRAFAPGGARQRWALLKFALLRLPIVGFGLYWLVRWDRIDLIAFCGGIVLVHFAILAKVMGIRLVERLKDESTGRKAAGIRTNGS